MKLTIVLSLVLAFTFNAHSQYFGEQGATWHYNKTYYSVPEVSYSKVWIEGTETHLGKTCQTIRLKNIGSCNEISSTTCLFENDSAVYLWEARDTSYKLLFDFKAKIGDTINQEFVTWQNNADTNSFKIDSIAFVTINGIKLKEFYYTPILGYTRRGGQKTIIKKLGFWTFSLVPFLTVLATCTTLKDSDVSKAQVLDFITPTKNKSAPTSHWVLSHQNYMER